MRYRLCITTFVALGVLSLFAVPADAGKPQPATATTSISSLGTCVFTVTYTWSGFRGTDLQAELALGYKALGGARVVFAWTFVPSQIGASGSVSATFTLTGTPTTQEYFGFGELFGSSNKDPSGLTAVKDSAANSAFLAPESCGSDVSIS